MRIIKYIFFGLLVLTGLLLLISVFLPKQVHVERSETIKAEAAVIYSLVNNPKTYNDWMPWNKMDKAMQIAFTGPQTGVGAGYSWKSEKREVGSGSLRITENSENEFVKLAMDFHENGNGTGEFMLKPVNGNTKVTWSMNSKFTGNFFKTAIGKYMGLFMDKLVGPSFEQGLNDIKKIAESPKPLTTLTDVSKPPVIKIEETDIKLQQILVIENLSANSVDAIGQELGVAFGKLNSEIKSQGLGVSGPPMVWYKNKKSPIIFTAGLPVNKPSIKLAVGFKLVTLQASKGVVAHFFGPYELISKGYEALGNWLLNNRKKFVGKPFEVYITDPQAEKDPYKWQTDIYFPIN